MVTRAGAIFIIALMVLSSSASGRCEDPPDFREIKTIEGQVSDIDWAGSKMVVRWLDQQDSTYYETSMAVPDEAEMTKGADIIGFSELEVADNVTARYYEDRDGNAILISLNVTSP